jgi:hypothetical protein
VSSDRVIIAAVERLTAAVVEALRHETPTPPAVRFLIRRYLATGLEDIRAALEPALTASLELSRQASADEQPAWLMMLADAAAVSDDDRIHESARALASVVQAGWGRRQRVRIAAAGVDACLRLNVPGLAEDSVQRSVDELERLVAAAYQPGEGIVEATFEGRPRLASQFIVASALLTGFERTDRLPYSMLAEELIQFASRSFRDAAGAGFTDGDDAPDTSAASTFAINCEAAAVLMRLAALHASADYRRDAVLAAGADYGRDATHILARLAPAAVELGLAGAVYGLAAADRQPAL